MGGPINGPAEQEAPLRGAGWASGRHVPVPKGRLLLSRRIYPAALRGVLPCAPTVRKRRCVVVPRRPGLNPRAKFGEAPCGGSGWAHCRAPLPLVNGRESPHTAYNGLPPFTRYSLCVRPHPSRPISPLSQPLNRYSLIVNRYSSLHLVSPPISRYNTPCPLASQRNNLPRPSIP